MRGSTLTSETILQTARRWASRAGLLCIGLAVTGGASGLMCPQEEMCTVNADCDDGLFCNGAETCVDMVCQDGAAPCTGDEVCNEDEGRCDACEADADCDDGLFCNGAETCVDGQCADAANPCDDDGVFCNGTESCDEDADACESSGDPCDPVTEECDEDSGSCLEICNNNADCDDELFCNGEETCVDGFCEDGTPACPDDGDFCNGTESCSEDTDTCVSSGNPCSDPTPVCDEDNDECVGGDPCTSDADCPSDDLFCTGTESCGVDGFCVSSGDPCTGDDTCDEDLNACIPPMGETIPFTLGTDSLTGTGGADTFSAPLLFNAPTGTNVPSLQTGDSAIGGDSPDILNAQFNFAAVTTVAPTLSDIETINVTDFGTAATTLAGTGVTGTTTFNFLNSTNGNAFTVTNLPTLANVGLQNQAIGATLTFATAATSGTSDEQTITVNGLTGAGTTVTVTTGTTNGVETLNLAANGNASNFSDIAMNGTTLTTVNVSGSANLTITTSLDANVTTVNASGATGNVSLTQNNAGNFTFTGGGGDDTILLGANYGTTDVLDGGAATDTLGANTAQLGGTTGNQTNVSNFEGLRVLDAHTTALNLSHYGSINSVTLDLGSNGGTITNAATGLALSCGVRAGAAVGGGTLGVTVAGSATTDSVTYTLNDCEQVGAVTFTGVETLNLVSNLDLDGSAANAGTAGQNTLQAALILTDTAALERVVCTGSEQLNITGAITANEVDASAMTQPFVMGATTTTVGVTVTGGGGADTLFGSTGNDIINGGAGNDAINPMAGNDIVTGGTGADTFRQASAAANGADRQQITDFDDTPTSGDVFNLNSGLATLDGTDNFATSASIQAHATAGNLTVTAAAEVVRVTSATVTDFTSANSLNGTNLLTAIGGTITVPNAGEERLFAVADTSGNVGIYFGDAGADTDVAAGELSLVAVLQGTNVALANLVFNNFSNGA